jgi:hypothetical protein
VSGFSRTVVRVGRGFGWTTLYVGSGFSRTVVLVVSVSRVRALRFGERLKLAPLGVRLEVAERLLDPINSGRYSFRYSLSRRVCVRLTGISVDFSSFILRM